MTLIRNHGQNRIQNPIQRRLRPGSSQRQQQSHCNHHCHSDRVNVASRQGSASRFPILSGLADAVMDFFSGGPIRRIVQAANEEGTGFLLPNLFGKICDCLRFHMHGEGHEDHAHHDHGNARPHGEGWNHDIGEHTAQNSHITVTEQSLITDSHGRQRYLNSMSGSYRQMQYASVHSLPDGVVTDHDETTYAPTQSGNGDGKQVHVFFGFKNHGKDVNMRRRNEAYLLDDIQRMRENGYEVVVNTRGTQAKFQAAVDNNDTAGIFWAGHGSPRGVQDSRQGHFFRPDQIRPNPEGNMRFCIFECCLTGRSENAWTQALNTDVFAHKRVIYDNEIAEFNDPDDRGDIEFDDLITERLIMQSWERTQDQQTESAQLEATS